MLDAIIWGLVQGLTEFLPVSSSGHLVIVPDLLDQMGFDISPPSLAISAMLHLGTLIAVVVYFRSDLVKVIRFRNDREGRTIATMVIIGTIPAVVGLPLKDTLESIQDDVTYVGIALIATGLILVVGQLVARGLRQLIDGKIPDAIVVGIAQVVALIPGISRSGITITAANGRRFEPTQSARFSFLLGIPAIAGAGLVSIPDLANAGGFGWDLIVGMLVAAVSGYAAIAFLLAALRRIGLIPFAIYALIVGTLTVAFL